MANKLKEIFDETYQEESNFEFANNLFDDKQTIRATRVFFRDFHGLNVLKALGDIQDAYRLKFLNNDKPCNLTIVVNINLNLRTSLDGWRANQVQKILEGKNIVKESVNEDSNRITNITTIDKK